MALAEGYLREAVPLPAFEATRGKLRAECTAVWRGGRQLCDAISLTRRPCTCRVHDLPTKSTPQGEALHLYSGEVTSVQVLVESCE